MLRPVEKLADRPVLDRLDARHGQGGTAPDDNLDADLGQGRLGDDQLGNGQLGNERDRPARGIMLGMAIGGAAWVLIGLAVLTWGS